MTSAFYFPLFSLILLFFKISPHSFSPLYFPIYSFSSIVTASMIPSLFARYDMHVGLFFQMCDVKKSLGKFWCWATCCFFWVCVDHCYKQMPSQLSNILWYCSLTCPWSLLHYQHCSLKAFPFRRPIDQKHFSQINCLANSYLSNA